MTNRFHLPIVVTTKDELTREQTIEYVERILTNLEETDKIYRTFVEDDGIDGAEAERLLNMIDDVRIEDIQSAKDAMKKLDDSDES